MPPTSAIFHFHECNNAFITHFHHNLKLKYMTLYGNSATHGSAYSEAYT